MSAGKDGYSWSCSPDELYSLDLNFNVTWLDSGTSHYRSHGLPLRCLSE
ncbi:hypothetical protein [uncultured Rikenella sp.]|nr:hypothetical protein [uncultured Rikenella sp.]